MTEPRRSDTVSDPSTSSTPAQPAPAGVDVTAARARCAAATPGPWGVVLGDQVVSQPINVNHGSASYKRCIARLDEYDYEDFEDYDGESDEPAGLTHDAEFIAAARADLPAALDEIERLRGEVKRLAGEVATQRYLYREAGNDRTELRAALDRVLALCDDWDAQPNRTAHHVDGKIRSARVRAAITGSSSSDEGDEQPRTCPNGHTAEANVFHLLPDGPTTQTWYPCGCVLQVPS